MSRKYTIYTPNCPFALCAGTKKLVKHKEFENFIIN
ncbi:MAG: excisionase [Ruminococcus sp.]|nr:excisionase [Ruminococcus sp.]